VIYGVRDMGRPSRIWTRAQRRLLGTVPDAVAGAKLGCCASTVRNWRRRWGIAGYSEGPRCTAVTNDAIFVGIWWSSANTEEVEVRLNLTTRQVRSQSIRLRRHGVVLKAMPRHRRRKPIF
jgi:transposase-like protein